MDGTRDGVPDKDATETGPEAQLRTDATMEGQYSGRNERRARGATSDDNQGRKQQECNQERK